LVIQGLRGWAGNLASELVAWALTRRDRTRLRADWLFWVHQQSNWKKTDGVHYSRFTPGLSGVLNESGRRGAYLLTLPRANARTLKRPKDVVSAYKDLKGWRTDMPVALVEAYGSLRDILTSYFGFSQAFKWLKRWRSPRTARALAWRGVDIGFLLQRDIVFTLFRDWPGARYLEQCLRRALRASQTEYLAVNGYEIVEGRVACRAAHLGGVKSIGYEHGISGPAHSWRTMVTSSVMANRNAADSLNVPMRILFEGRLGAGHMARLGFPAERIGILGAPRLASVPVRDVLEPPERSVFVLGDIHRPEALFGWVLNRLAGSDYTFIFRPHPRHYYSLGEWLTAQEIERHKLTISDRTETLETEVHRCQPTALLVSGTGTAIDLAADGWPVIVVLSNWAPDYNPLTWTEKSRTFCSGDAAQILDWLERLYGDSSFRADYVDQCRGVFDQLVDATGLEAVRRLVEPF